MDIEEAWEHNSKLYEEMKENRHPELEKQIKEIDLEKYTWNTDVRRCETSEDAKLLAHVLSDGQYDDGDMAYIVEDVAANLENRDAINHQLAELDEDMAKNAERLRKAREMLSNLNLNNIAGDLKKRTERDSLDNLRKLTKDELNDRLTEIADRLEGLRVEREGPGCIPEIRQGIQKYMRLIRETRDFKPKGAVLAASRGRPEMPTAKKSVKQLLLDRSDELELPHSMRHFIKKQLDEENKPGQGLDCLLELAKNQGISEENLPDYIKNNLMPEFVREWTENKEIEE